MSCSVKQKVSRLWLQGLPTPAGPILWARHPGKGVITVYWKFPSAPGSVSSPGLFRCPVSLLTHPQGLHSWERLQGNYRQPSIAAFMNSAPSILKMKKLRYKMVNYLAKGMSCHGLWSCKPRDPATGWNLEHSWNSAPPQQPDSVEHSPG